MSAARDRAVRLFRDAFPDDLTDAEGVTIEQLRRCDNDFWNSFLPENAIVEPVDAGGVPALWVGVPGSREDRAVVWYHGGGYTVGSAEGRRAIAAEVARVAGCRVLVPGYRLAPEHPFPAGVEDAIASCAWAVDLLGPASVVLGGDSAGAGLMLASLLATRDHGLPLPAAAVAVSPFADWTLASESHGLKRDVDQLVTAEMLEKLRPGYLGDTDPREPLASPVFGDYAGLPPLLVLAGTDETLLDDALGVVRRAALAGVAVELRVFDGMFHVWPLFSTILPEGREAVELIGRFAKAHTTVLL
jgi:acetyl esterase/lipase